MLSQSIASAGGRVRAVLSPSTAVNAETLREQSLSLVCAAMASLIALFALQQALLPGAIGIIGVGTASLGPLGLLFLGLHRYLWGVPTTAWLSRLCRPIGSLLVVSLAIEACIAATMGVATVFLLVLHFIAFCVVSI